MQVGSLLICVEDVNNTLANLKMAGNRVPEINEIYVARELVKVLGRTCIRLVEIVNTPQEFDGTDEPVECCFLGECFREIQPPMDLTELLKETEPQTVLVTR